MPIDKQKINNPKDFFITFYKALREWSPFPYHIKAFLHYVDPEKRKKFKILGPTGVAKTEFLPIHLIAMAWENYSGTTLSIKTRFTLVEALRPVVDQASKIAASMCDKLANPDSDELKFLASLLAQRSYLGRQGESPVCFAVLRGEHLDSGDWRLDPSRPAIIIGTPDMIGSRLLFSGYGCGKSKRAMDAGLIGCDNHIVIDEVHLMPELAYMITNVCEAQKSMPQFIRNLEFSYMSATMQVDDEEGLVQLGKEDFQHEVIAKRLNAEKRVFLHCIKNFEEETICKEVSEIIDKSTQKRHLIYFHSASKVLHLSQSEELEKIVGKSNISILTGTIRGYERRKMIENDPIYKNMLSDPERREAEHKIILISSSAGECGADLCGEGGIMDLVSFVRSIQRFGRYSRLGNFPSKIHILYTKKMIKKNSECAECLNFLKSRPGNMKKGFDVSPSALMKDPQPKMQPIDTLSPKNTKLVPLSDHILNLFSMTSLTSEDIKKPTPDIFIHGPSKDNTPEVYLLWRKEIELLSDDYVITEADLEAYIEKFPPSTLEKVKLPLYRLNENRTKDDKDKAYIAGIHSALDEKILVFDPEAKVKRTTLRNAIKEGFVANSVIFFSTNAANLKNGVLSNKGDEIVKDVSEHSETRPYRRFHVTRTGEGYFHAERYGVQSEWSADGKTLNSIIKLIGSKTGQSLVHTLPIYLPIESIEENDPCNQWNELLLYFGDKKLRCYAKQELKEHSQETGECAYQIASILKLPKKIIDAVQISGKKHDSGKGHTAWRLASDSFDIPLAKCPVLNTRLLNGYRHELGSVLDAIAENEDDLSLHLIAASHGHGRPYFSHRSYDFDFSISTNKKIVKQIRRLFFRLQRKFGFWGLAYLESIVKCADILTSIRSQKEKKNG